MMMYTMTLVLVWELAIATGPSSRTLRQRGLIWPVLQSPKPEASPKQTYFANARACLLEKARLYFVQYKTVKLLKSFKIFTSVVKVVSLTYFEELLIRNRAMCLILCYGHISLIVVFSKTAPFLGLKSIVFCPNYYVTTANRSAICPLFS